MSNAQNNEVETISNTADLTDLGQAAIKALQTGNKAIGRANALFTYVIAQAWVMKTFETQIDYKEGPEQHSFDLEDIATNAGIQKEDGKKDNRKSKARLDCVALELFGLTKGFDVSQTNMFKDCLNVVKNLHELGYDLEEHVQLSDKAQNLMVPYEVIVPEPDSENANEVSRYNMLKGSMYALDGKIRQSTFAELKRRVTPTKPRTPQQGANKPVELKGSVDFLIRSLKALQDETGETEHNIAAPNEDTRKELFALKLQLDKLFASDPIQTKETVSKTTKKAA